MRYRVLGAIPTNRGRSVHVAEGEGGGLLLVKRAHTAAEATALRLQARHLQVMGRLLGGRSVYPPVLAVGRHELVLPFYEHGSLGDVAASGDGGALAALMAAALHRLFEIAVTPAPGGRRAVNAGYLAAEMEARLTRLRTAMGATRTGARWAAAPAPVGGRTHGELVAEVTSWLDPDRLRGARLGPPALGLAGHGDFDPHNVVLTSPPGPGAGFLFVDTRGRWRDGLPWWDPVMDLATCIAFHCRIEPLIGRVGPPSPHSTAVAEAELLALCAADAAFQAWAERDPAWPYRLQIAIAIRLLGNVGTLLTAAASDGPRRATAVLGALLEQAPRARSAMRG